MHDHESHNHHAHSVPDSPEKMLALLNHLKEHNEEHTHELEGLIQALKDAGKDAAAEKLSMAVEAYNNGNRLMADVVSLF